MNVYISYFYQIRNMSHREIPLSTAVWDPKWFHNNKGKKYVFIKNKVIHGLRIEQLSPDDTCNNLCRGRESCSSTPQKCEFLKNYRKQLDKINFNKFIDELNKLNDSLKLSNNEMNDYNIVLIVYETPDNPCSERVVLKEWFKNNGYELKEWSEVHD